MKERNAADILREEKGSLMLDALVSIVLSSILAAGLTQSMMVAYRYSHKEVTDSGATQLAIERLEQYANQNPEGLADGDQVIENVTKNGISYRVQVDVSLDVNRTRDVTVTVSSLRTKLPTEVQLTNSFALWGER